MNGICLKLQKNQTTAWSPNTQKEFCCGKRNKIQLEPNLIYWIQQNIHGSFRIYTYLQSSLRKGTEIKFEDYIIWFDDVADANKFNETFNHTETFRQNRGKWYDHGGQYRQEIIIIGEK